MRFTSATVIAAVTAAAFPIAAVVTAPTAAAGVDPASLNQDAQQSQITDTEGYLTSADGRGTQIYWHSQVQPNAKANVLVVHGLSEHSGRYDHVTQRLLDAGYNVYRMDHRGHGKSSEPFVNTAPRGHVNDFAALVDDIDLVAQKAKAEHPELKNFMLGHSLGAFAAEFYGIKYDGQMDAIATNGGGAPFNLSGTEDEGPEQITPEMITDVQRQLAPAPLSQLPLDQLTTLNGQMLREVIPGRVDARFVVPDVTAIPRMSNPLSDALTSDPRVLEAYDNDPLNAHTMTLGTIAETGFGLLYNSLNADKFTTPTLVMHGASDGLVPPFLSTNWYNAISSTDKEYIQWTGQKHEVFNEIPRDEPISKVISFFDEHL